MSESEQLRKLTRAQRRMLSGFACAWCEQPADMAGCGAIYSRCDEQLRCAKRKTLLGENPRTLGGEDGIRTHVTTES